MDAATVAWAIAAGRRSLYGNESGARQLLIFSYHSQGGFAPGLFPLHWLKADYSNQELGPNLLQPEKKILDFCVRHTLSRHILPLARRPVGLVTELSRYIFGNRYRSRFIQGSLN